jgi:hypothetical protein
VTITFDTNNINCSTTDDPLTDITTTNIPAWTYVSCQIDQPVAGQTLVTYSTTGQQSATTYNVSVTANVQDNVGNPATLYNFSYTTTDADPPSSTVTDPADAVLITSTAPDPLNISGTASDNVNVTSVEVSINGGAWNAATCNDCPGDNVVWTYAWTLPADGSYTIQSRATDAEPNVETPGAGNTVTIDRSVPASTITAPADGTYLSSGDFPYNINGSATDAGTNITGVEVSTDGGGSWTAATCTGCPGTNVTWNYSWTTPAIEGNYTIRVRATDVANNVEAPTPGNNATYDGTSPSVAATSPANSATDVATDRDVIITFTEDNLDCTTVDTTNITSDSPGWTLSTCDDVTGVVTFTTSGQSNYTIYNVNITTAVADKSGNALASAYPFSYTVGTANTAPGNPSGLAQYKTDDSTQITQGSTTDETSIVIRATVSDPDADDILIEAEITTGSFTNTPNCTIGDAVSSPYLTPAKVTCGNLTDGGNYKWQIRAFDGKEYSNWVAYGANPDVQIVTPLNTSVMLHNSTNLDADYWGGWGIAGQKYGEFTCETCHTDDPANPNIKRIKQNITAPDPSPSDFPGSGETVVFDKPSGTATYQGASGVLGDDTSCSNDSSKTTQGDCEGGGGTWSPRTTSDRVCEVCHSQTKYHRYDASTQSAGNHGHNNAVDCTTCHYHNGGFKPVGGGGECTSCHNGIPGTSYVERDVVGSDFNDAVQTSRHVFGGTVTNWDCVVCHMEGDAAEAAAGTAATTADHPFSNGKVDLRDVDTGGLSFIWDKGAITDTMLTNMDNFCMKCHDSDASRGAGLGGASYIAVNAAGTGVALKGVTADPTFDERMKPFNPTDELDTGAGGGSITQAGYERTAVMDAYGMFDTNNESFHPVRGQAYSTHNTNWGDAAWVNAPLKNGTNLMDNYEASTLHCADCHTVDLNAHGGGNDFMLTSATIDDTCYQCHNSNVYSDNYVAGTTRWDHSNETQAWNAGNESTFGGSFCLNCHGGQIGDGGSFLDGYGGMHGMDSGTTGGPGSLGVDPNSGQPRYRFQGGIYMSHDPGDWTGTGGSDGSCYFAASKTVDWSSCGQHNSLQQGRTVSPLYSRGTPGQY